MDEHEIATIGLTLTQSGKRYLCRARVAHDLLPLVAADDPVKAAHLAIEEAGPHIVRRALALLRTETTP
jgi:hypothetical protein